MSEFRSTTSEFKETWQREANFEEEIKSFDLNALEAEPVARVESLSTSSETIDAPEIKQVNPADFERLKAAAIEEKPTEAADIEPANDKKNWL